MPALGARPSAIREAAGRPAPRSRPSPLRPVAYLFGAPLRSQPFAPAQRAAQRHVERVTPRPTPPHIPVLPHPTLGQIHAAHEIAANYQRSQLPHNASAADIRAYQQRLGATPQGRAFQQSVAHYLSHGQAVARSGVSPETPAPLYRRGKVRPGNAPSSLRLPLAEIKIPTGAISAAISNAVAKATPGLQGASAESGLVRRALGDVGAIGTFPLVGGYRAADAIRAAAGGNLTPAEQFASDIAKGVAHGAVGELVQGHLKGAGHAVSQHPLLSLLETAGLAGVVGRGAGALARTGGAEAASTVRPALALTEDSAAARRGLVRQREYSKDLTRKAVQILADKRRQPLTDAQGKLVHRVERGKAVPVLKATPREIERFQKQRANFASSRAVALGREARHAAETGYLRNTYGGRGPLPLRALTGAVRAGGLKPVRIAGSVAPIAAATLRQHLQQLVATGTIRSARTFREDLQNRIAGIQTALGEHTYRTKADRKAAEGNLRLLQAASSEKVLREAPAIVRAGLKHAKALNRGDAALEARRVYPAAQLERARLSEYALAHMGAKHFTGEEHGATPGAGLRHPDGRFLSNDEIRAHAEAAGRNPDTLAYLPHRVGVQRARSFYKQFRPGSRPIGNEARRTGELYRSGATAISSRLIHDELANKATTIAKVESLDHLIQETGLRHPDFQRAAAQGKPGKAQRTLNRKGGYFTGKEALEAANRLSEDTGVPHVAVRAFAGRLPQAAQTALREEQTPATMESAHLDLLRGRLISPEDSSAARNAVLMPTTLVSQLEKQLQPSQHRLLQMLNGPFRMAVLPQPRWLTGNFIEPFIVRLPLSGSGANIPGLLTDLRAANKAVKALEGGGRAEKLAASQIRALQFQGLFIGRRSASVHRSFKDFTGDTERALYGAHVVRNAPIVKQMGDMLLGIPKSFFALNRIIEGTAQRAAFGKQFRSDIQAFTGKWSETVRLGDQAVKEAAKGLVDTATQHRFMEKQYELLGQYDGFSPQLRGFIQSAAPFLPWTLNSMRFVYWTLPAHHTVAFEASVKAAEAVMSEWQAEHSETPPGSLQFAPRTKSGGYVDVGRYTPFSIPTDLSTGVAGGLASAGQAFLPQINSAILALSGRDPFQRDLQVPKPGGGNAKASEGQRLGIAANDLLEALVPGVSTARRLQEKGGTGYSNSTVFSPKVKPGTEHMSALERTFDPFRAIYLKPPKGKKAGATSAFGTLQQARAAAQGGASRPGSAFALLQKARAK